MKHKLSKREDFFNKEINNFKKEQAVLEKKLDKLENPPEPPVKKEPRSDSPKKKMTDKEKKAAEEEAKKKAEEERLKKLKEEEEAKKKAEEEEKRKKEEEEAAKKKGGKAPPKGKPVAAEETHVEEKVVETEEQKRAKEIVIVKEQLEQMKTKIDQYSAKLKLCIDEKNRQDPEEKRKKTLDLVEKGSGDRKFLKAGSRDYANTLLAERRCYIFSEVLPGHENPNEEEAKPLVINGAAIRTPAEDITWEQEQKELEANAPVKGKGAPAKGKPGKK